MDFIKLNLWVIVGTTVTFFACIGLVEYLDYVRFKAMSLDVLPFFIGVLVIPIIVSATVCFAIFNSIVYASKSLQLKTVAFSYAILIVCFSGVYYTQAAFGDFNQSISEKHYYESLTNPIYSPDLESGQDMYLSKSERSFRGIEDRLWFGVQDYIAWSDYAGVPPIQKLISAAQMDVKGIVKLNRKNRVPVFIDCLYFSVATITTLGFGDITPKSALAKITVSVQAVLGIVLVALGIGLALNRRSDGDDS